MKTQTNRTILFEKVNEEKDTILSLIHMQNAKESLSDEEVQAIHRALKVSGFADFVEKFSPAVYMFLDPEKGIVRFTRECTDSRQIRISLGESYGVAERIWEMLSAKRNKIYSFQEFAQMGDQLLTKKDPYIFDVARNEILALLNEDGNDAAETAERKLKELISEKYDVFYLLLVFLHDTEKFCEKREENRINRGIIRDNGKLQVQVVETAADYHNGFLQYPLQTLEKYEALVRGILTEESIERDVLLLPCTFGKEQIQEIGVQYRKYAALYETVIRRFWSCAAPLLETMFGVREFFAQQREAKEPAKLIIANMAVEEILDVRNKAKLDIYLRSVNTKVFYENTLWYAILPHARMESQKNGRQIRERFAASAKESFEEIRCEKEEIQSLTELLVTYKIQIFLSMGSGQSATFTQVASEGLDVLEQTLSGYEKMEDKDYFIPCYPNFVILSDAEAYLRIGKKVAIDEMSGEISMGGNWDIWLRGLEVEASYVAAGMFAACQDSDYLSAHFRRGINTDNPGVGYRFSEEANAEHTVSDMLSDTREWSKALTQEIQKRARGVVFAQKNGQMQILTDRTFAYSGEKRLLVSMVQTITYIERTLQKETQDFKKNLILQFFQKRPGSVLADWMSEEQNCINPVLRQEETLTYQMNEEEDSCVFTVDFGGSRLTRKNKVIVLDE